MAPQYRHLPPSRCRVCEPVGLEDRRTIPRPLKTWAEEERTHGGVVFVDEKTISPADIGGLVWALTRLAREKGNWDWTNRIYFLRR
jgi:hypothetical protein